MKKAELNKQIVANNIKSLFAVNNCCAKQVNGYEYYDMFYLSYRKIRNFIKKFFNNETFGIAANLKHRVVELSEYNKYVTDVFVYSDRLVLAGVIGMLKVEVINNVIFIDVRDYKNKKENINDMRLTELFIKTRILERALKWKYGKNNVVINSIGFTDGENEYILERSEYYTLNMKSFSKLKNALINRANWYKENAMILVRKKLAREGQFYFGDHPEQLVMF